MTVLDDLKGRLQITWDDDDPDLEKLIKRSKSYLERLTGATFSMDVDDWKTDLLLERCRYTYNNAADEYEKNFSHELKRLILETAIEKVKHIEKDPTNV